MHACILCCLSNLKSLSLKDNSCQRSAHQRKHDLAQRMKPHSSWGRIAKSWRARPIGLQAAGQVLRSEPHHQPPGVRNLRQSTPLTSSPSGWASLNPSACICHYCTTYKESPGCVLSLYGHLRLPHWINCNQNSVYATANLLKMLLLTQ